MHDQWIQTIQQQIDKLNITAEWASIVGYGTVRDHIRIAIYDLKHKIDVLREQDEKRELDAREFRDEMRSVK